MKLGHHCPFQVCTPKPKQVCNEVPDGNRVERVCRPAETEECREVPRRRCRPDRKCSLVEKSTPKGRECAKVPERVCEERERQVLKQVCQPSPRQECRYGFALLRCILGFNSASSYGSNLCNTD